jgi:protein subunit release factor A
METLDMRDVRIDAYRAGPVVTYYRATHIPTGTVVECECATSKEAVALLEAKVREAGGQNGGAGEATSPGSSAYSCR